MPWALAAGHGIQVIAGWLARRPQPLQFVAAGAAAALLVLLAAYPWLMFSDAPAERLRQWETKQPRAYWYPFAQPPERAIMGFPLRNGWKAAGALYAGGALAGTFQTNARPQVADWYTRVSAERSIGFFQIGGGIAGDFPICVVPMLHQDLGRENVPMWGYFCQISDSTTSYGSYSGAVPNEKITWGKLAVDTPKFIVESDATIVAPLMFALDLGW